MTCYGLKAAMVTLAATVATIGAAPASAASPALAEALATAIDQTMRAPTVLGGQEAPSGIARVAFSVGADGRAHDVTLDRRSGSGVIDRAAVRLIASLHDLPAGDGRTDYAVLQYGSAGDAVDSARYKRALQTQVALARSEANRGVRSASLDLAGKALAYNAPGDLPRGR